jgi:cytochrome c oxidase subunit 3
VDVPVLFVLVMLAILVWWFLVSKLMAKPWETPGDINEVDSSGAATRTAPARMGLWVFLAVITSFFGLFVSAYTERMDVADWTPLAEPNLLWFNTLVLILGSVAFQRARGAVNRGDAHGVRINLIAGGLLTMVFLGGQLLVWQQLGELGYFVGSNPANAFFYLLTALHGLHLLGGLWVWGRTLARLYTARSEKQLGKVGLSVELCSVYWHYLLVVWLILFGLLLAT